MAKRKYTRRYIKLLEHEYQGGFKPGNIVTVQSSSTFKGEAIGAVLPPQKWCEEGIPVYVTHESMKYVCILPNRKGDTIKRATKDDKSKEAV